MENLDDLRALVRAAGNRRLPSVRALAARWRHSPATVRKILGEGRRRGWIETRPGAGSWAAGRLPRKPEPAARLDSAGLAAEIREAIRGGKWAGGETLPPPKHLAERHGVHPATVRKALGLLAGEAILERKGRSWLVSRPRRRPAAQPVLLCLGAADDKGKLRLATDREWDFWREIQAEAAHNGLLPLIEPWNGRLPKKDSRMLGAVVSTWHMPDPRPLLAAVHRARLPAAVWLENPRLSPGRPPLASPWIGFHDMAYGRESGAILAGHPIVRQHGRIAWVSPFHGAEWSRNRLEGLRESLREGTRLHEAVGPWLSEWDFEDAAWRDPEVWKRLRLEGVGPPGHAADLARPLMEAIGRDRLLEAFSPALETALASAATLWIAASDRIALGCLDWLAERGVRVPEDVALAGFDDSRDALRYGLTSVRFDAQAMARAMVRQVLSPDRDRRRTLHYHGAVIVRGSTPARG